jgi:hypothetical protein
MDAIMGRPCDGSNEGGPSLNSSRALRCGTRHHAGARDHAVRRGDLRQPRGGGFRDSDRRGMWTTNGRVTVPRLWLVPGKGRALCAPRTPAGYLTKVI